MQGRRLPNMKHDGLPKMEPGDYVYVQPQQRWYGVTPNGLLFFFNDKHILRETDDGLLTVDPSIMVQNDWESKGRTWHGWLRAGVWSEA
jgi:hypothetical protein